MIRAAFIDGHWRVIDQFERRYATIDEPNDGAVDGAFISSNGALSDGWDTRTRFDEHAALVLAGVLRRLFAMNQERAQRSLKICDPCRRRLLSDAK